MRLITKFGWVLLIAVLVVSCGGKKKANNQDAQLTEAKGYFMDGDKKIKIYYGGNFRMNEVEYFQSLYPHTLIDASSSRIASQIYQGLFKFDQKTLEPVNCLAESFEANADATEFTFKLRKGVMFQDDACFPDGKGREMTAKDVKYCFDKLCSKYAANVNSGILVEHVLGAKEYFDNGPSPEGVSGIEIVDDYTIKIKLVSSYSAFTSLLAHSACYIFPAEAYEKYGEGMNDHPVGTGPFQVKKIVKDQVVLLEKNKSYWEIDENGNQLPYMDMVKVTFTKDKGAELSNFRKGNLDMVWQLPVDEMDNVLTSLEEAKQGGNPEFKYQQVNGLSTEFYAFNANSDMFKDKRVRRAFNLAINRESLINYTIKGEGEGAWHGFVPKMPLYDNESIEGFEFNPTEAKKLLAEAGYPGGQGFPSVTLVCNRGGKLNKDVANQVYNDLNENLGIAIGIEMVDRNNQIERFSTGQTDFTRTSWIADIPDPSDFLKLFYGKLVPDDPNAKSLPNFSRYKNPVFDEFYEAGISAIDQNVKNDYFNKCDSVLIEDAALIPLFHKQYTRLIGVNVVGLPINAIEHRDLTKVFFEKSSED